MSIKKLFIDNFEIAGITGLERKFHAAVKHTVNPVLSPEKPWEIKTGREGVGCPKVIYDEREKIYKMWYWSSVDGLKNLYATSKNGIDWERPSLGMVEFNSSFDNNIVSTPGRIGPGAVLICPESIAVEGEDKLYRTMSWVPAEKWSQRYIPIFSPDGIKWHTHENIDEEPGISGPGVGDTGTVMLADDNFPMEQDDIQGRYVAFPRLHTKVGKWGRRSVGMTACNATPDRKRLMLDWPVPSLVLAPDLIDDEMAHERLIKACKDGITHYDDPREHHCEFYAMQPWRNGNVFIGAVYVFDVSMNMSKRGAWNDHGIMEIQLVCSRDLIHWERLGDRKPWICRGEPGSFDDSIVHFSSVPVQIGDQMVVYYTATNIPHPTCNMRIVNSFAEQILSGKRHGIQHIGCATFRPDGYVSLYAGETKGEVITKAFTYRGDDMYLNADAKSGEVAVYLCDEAGRRLKGLASNPVLGNSFNEKLVFPKEKIDQLKGKKISLSFTVRNAHLYSYTI